VLGPRDFLACTELFRKWVDVKSLRHSPWLAEYHQEFDAFALALRHYDQLRLEGLGVRVDAKLVAFLLYNSHCADTVIGHFLKYDPTIKGACEIMVWELAQRLCATYRYLNFEQDMGIPGLRQFKSSYNPVEQLASWVLSRK
jgi:hypothetical protein